jgi:hypothetical protein
MIVRVLTDNGGPRPVGLIARVVEERENDYIILFLTAAEDRDRGRTVYRYEDSTYTIDDDYVIEYFDDENEAGFKETNDGGWIKASSDEDYIPSESDVEGESEEDEDCSEDEYIDEDEEEYIDDD